MNDTGFTVGGFLHRLPRDIGEPIISPQEIVAPQMRRLQIVGQLRQFSLHAEGYQGQLLGGIPLDGIIADSGALAFRLAVHHQLGTLVAQTV